MRAVRAVADRALTLLAALGLVCLVLALAGPAFGVHALFFRSGSMEPTIGTGAMALSVRVPVAEIRVGDIVSVTTSASGSRVTHRVVSRRGDELVLKGDANAVPDAAPYRAATADRVVAHVPLLGYAVGWLAGPIGLGLLGVLGLGLLALVVRPELLAAAASVPEPVRAAHRGRRRSLLSGAGVVALVTVSVVGPGQVRPGWAAPWTDPVPVSGSSYTAGVVGAPVVSCTVSVGSVRFDWSAVASATGYRVHYGTGGGTSLPVGSGVTTYSVSLFGAGTFWVEALRAFPSATWESASSNKKSYAITAVVLASCTDP